MSEPKKRRWLPRFSLKSLLLLVLLVASSYGLWWRWEPWVLKAILEGHDQLIFSQDEERIITWIARI